MNRKLPLTPFETDAILYVIISVLLLISVNNVLAQSHVSLDCTNVEAFCFSDQASSLNEAELLFDRNQTHISSQALSESAGETVQFINPSCIDRLCSVIKHKECNAAHSNVELGKNVSSNIFRMRELKD